MEQVANLKTWHITTTYTQPTTFSSPEPWFLLGHDKTEGSGSSNYRMSMIYACICMIIACISAHAQKLNPRGGERGIECIFKVDKLGFKEVLTKRTIKQKAALNASLQKQLQACLTFYQQVSLHVHFVVGCLETVRNQELCSCCLLYKKEKFKVCLHPRVLKFLLTFSVL